MRPEATTELAQCRVRSETDHPCPRPAVVKICGVPFCEWCAREQKAYFSVGELTQAPPALPVGGLAAGARAADLYVLMVRH